MPTTAKASPFSPDYAAARARFRQAAADTGADLAAYAHPETGPDGGDLSTDVAWIGPADAPGVFVTVSATHGVEGFCGSGAQIDWLERGEAARLPAGIAALVVHAINPYGFAWLRRVTHENVDLNRNWIDFAKPLPPTPAYDGMHAVFCPADWAPETQTATRAVMRAYADEHGMAGLQQAMTAGQYGHPDGLFFGGQAPCWSRRTLTAIFEQYLARAKHVGVIDYHTGLGPYGYAEQIVSAPPGSPGHLRARQAHGAAAIPGGIPASSSAALTGDWLDAMPRIVPHAEITAIALEYGTQPPMMVLDSLRADNWLHAHGDPASPEGQAIKRQILAAFYGDDDIWRGMVLGQSLIAARQSAAWLAAQLAAG